MNLFLKVEGFMFMLRFGLGILSVGLMVLGPCMVSGQDYPNKVIRIVTAPAGGGSDFAARLVAQGISGPLDQSLIVDNRKTPGVAIEIVSKAPPDGYTVLVTGGAFWISPLLQKVSYDVVGDFLPISLLVREVNVLSVHPSVQVNSVKELIALAKAKPGELNYSSSISGSPAHLGAELFKSMAGVNIVGVAYKGAAPAMIALISSEVQLTIADVGLAAPHWKSGKLRALAVTTADPSTLAPGLPTVAASGLPGYEMAAMTSIFAPAKTPGAIVNRLNREIVRVFNLADVKEKVLKAGAEPVGSSPEALATTVKSEIAKWSKVIKEAGIKND